MSDRQQTSDYYGFSLTSSVRFPGVKLSPEGNAIEVGALNLSEVPGASSALL